MISFVIPTYNEADAIVSTASDIEKILKKEKIEKYEIIVVNDGSTDDTVKNIEKYLKQNTKTQNTNKANTKIISNPHNMGYGYSIKRGIKNAKYNDIVIIDADGTYPVKHFPELYKEYKKGMDMVVGARTGKYYRENGIKSILRRFLRLLAEWAAGRKIVDINSGFRIFNKKTVEKHLDRLCDTLSFTTSITLVYMMTSKFVSYIPITYDKRIGKSKVRLFKDSLKTLQYILQITNYYNPIKVFILFSFMCLCVSFFGFIFSILSTLKIGYIIGIGSFFIALIVICFGLIANLLQQILEK